GGLFFAIIAYSNANLSVPAALGVNTLVIILFIAHIVYHDLPLAQLRRRISK
ncbi:MAG: lipopolysaccharide biosynthesis protein, partial [Prevotella denticola]